MEISTIPTEKIVPNKFNPNKMPSSTFKKLLASIKKFGLFNPILVRIKDKGYEVVDGEWRWRAHVELKIEYMPCRVIEATDEEVKQMIFATKITGRHNAYDSQEVLKDLLHADNATLGACNLDKLKLERKTKYMNFDKGRRLKKDSRDMKDESVGLPTNEHYKCIFAVALSKTDYDLVVDFLKSCDKNIGQALVSNIRAMKAQKL